jgi:hypothetical protein
MEEADHVRADDDPSRYQNCQAGAAFEGGGAFG